MPLWGWYLRTSRLVSGSHRLGSTVLYQTSRGGAADRALCSRLMDQLAFFVSVYPFSVFALL